jgi:hypothetical protein
VGNPAFDGILAPYFAFGAGVGSRKETQ